MFLRQKDGLGLLPSLAHPRHAAQLRSALTIGERVELVLPAYRFSEKQRFVLLVITDRRLLLVGRDDVEGVNISDVNEVVLSREDSLLAFDKLVVVARTRVDELVVYLDASEKHAESLLELQSQDGLGLS